MFLIAKLRWYSTLNRNVSKKDLYDLEKKFDGINCMYLSTWNYLAYAAVTLSMHQKAALLTVLPVPLQIRMIT